MAEALDLSTKEAYHLVSFVHAGGAAYYTDWTSDVSFNGNDYISTPDMEVKLPANDGLFGEQVCNVAVPKTSGDATNDTFADRISNGQPHAETTVTVVEIVRPTVAGPSQNTNTLFVGEISRARRNFRKRRDKIQISALPIKSRLADISLGLPTMHHCINRLGDDGCKVDMTGSPRRVSAVITAIDGRKVTIQTNAAVEAQADRFYQRGFIQFEGLNVDTQDWRSADPLDFFMVRQVPDHWLNQVVVIVAGCDQTVETCRSRYSNEDNFNGVGIAMPAYNPNFEDAP